MSTSGDRRRRAITWRQIRREKSCLCTPLAPRHESRMKLRDHGTHFYNRILQLLNLFVLLYEQLSLQCENTALSSESLFREVMKESEGLGDLRLIWLTVTKFERSICCVKVRRALVACR